MNTAAAITYWVLLLSKVGETSGLPMAVYTDQLACEREAGRKEVNYKPTDEMHWHCLGVIMNARLPPALTERPR